MQNQDKRTKEVCNELGISYATLWRISRKLKMFPKERKCKIIYTQKDVELIRNELRKENACHIS
jgi:predicted DNA-binding transcriptional regulator AlpA